MNKRNLAVSASKVGLSLIPLVGSLYNELILYFDEKRINGRFQRIEDKLNKYELSIEDISKIIEKFKDHEYYVLRNNLRNVITTSLPETVETYNNALIEYIMDESNRSMNEEVSEIISQLNKNDIELLKRLKKFINSDFKQIEKEKCYEKHEKTSEDKFVSRNIIWGNNTIFLKDYRAYYLENSDDFPSVDLLMNIGFKDSKNNPYYYFAYESRSLIKLQNLGVVSLDFISTLGTISSGNIDRIHISIFGEKLLNYIE
ncbi:hypothetical protein [Clostridium ganghwense]|uniref:Uncharacterized protein n=1 Tax=Clostridium ganghwense TaxID=312089 RepID=A0ABT4CMH2_9CLOT|nr:hypothetical protein [Clostridium ganghwense]MCY6370249.1 hypothetical protein [Clostridium ganghwense]